MENVGLYQKRKAAILSVVVSKIKPAIAFWGLYKNFPFVAETSRKLEPIPPHLRVSDEEAEARAEHALIIHRLMQEAGKRPISAPATTPEPAKPQTPEEAWRHDPALRKEFNDNFACYKSYLKAEAAGRARVCGRKS